MRAWALETGSIALPTNAPTQKPLNREEITAACKIVMEDKLNGLRGGIFNLTNKTELQTKLISNITTTLVEGLRWESPGHTV